MKPSSSWKLSDKHNLTVLLKRGRYFFKEGGGEAKSKPTTEVQYKGIEDSLVLSTREFMKVPLYSV